MCSDRTPGLAIFSDIFPTHWPSRREMAPGSPPRSPPRSPLIYLTDFHRKRMTAVICPEGELSFLRKAGQPWRQALARAVHMPQIELSNKVWTCCGGEGGGERYVCPCAHLRFAFTIGSRRTDAGTKPVLNCFDSICLAAFLSKLLLKR